MSVIKVKTQVQVSSVKVEAALRSARTRFNRVLADKFADMARSNFGISGGAYRPSPWGSYKRNYGPGKRVGDPASLIKSSVLFNSINATANESCGEVSAQGSRNYAYAHQFGSSHSNLPARPYLPVIQTSTGFVLIPRSEKEMLAALLAEVQHVINSVK